MAKHKGLQPQNLDKRKSKVVQTTSGLVTSGLATKGLTTKGPATRGPVTRASTRHKKIALCQVEMIHWELFELLGIRFHKIA